MTELVEKYRLACAEWLDKQKAADILEDTKKIVFAEICSGIDASSEAAKSRLAMISQDWKDHTAKTSEANHEARRARMIVRLRQMEFDAWRTEAANSRNERGNY